ncbi:type II secretion system protein [Massilia litorea]|jgi:MSHA pilin protein MshA|uniref:Type II secretion system protein n=1 Tax=Massilia litorea TaxID=2769491 RepID=A0A7L9U2B5_9BURK|nr:type II secretion system protein [Massilia litorea]QOL49108.1 type II secretion system protein [Massilia litorea]
MNKSIKAAQGGFTLIELIVVIVILGILAATALPKFASLSGEARLASLNAAKGALNATAAMTHGKYLVAPNATMTVEGVAVSMNTTSGYPAVTDQASAEALAAAAGLSTADYKVYITGSGTTQPTVVANQFAVVPNSVVDTKTAKKCFVLFTAPTAANTAPTITVGSPTSPTAVADCE